jgi:hypothetical protein
MATATPALANRTVVKINVDSKGGVESVTPNQFEVSKGKQEEVIWIVDSFQPVYFTVEFKGQSPFYESQFSSDFPVSGLVRREVLADPLKEYKYTVRAGGKTLDPVGIVKP